MMNSYLLLTQYVNVNLLKVSRNQITFRFFENLNENIHAFPIEKLMNISNDRLFIYEVYYVILNRLIDNNRVDELLHILRDSNESARMQIIKDAYNSKERQVKNTKIIFNEEYSL